MLLILFWIRISSLGEAVTCPKLNGGGTRIWHLQPTALSTISFSLLLHYVSKILNLIFSAPTMAKVEVELCRGYNMGLGAGDGPYSSCPDFCFLHMLCNLHQVLSTLWGSKEWHACSKKWGRCSSEENGEGSSLVVFHSHFCSKHQVQVKSVCTIFQPSLPLSSMLVYGQLTGYPSIHVINIRPLVRLTVEHWILLPWMDFSTPV